jgi:hypothetical protein
MNAGRGRFVFSRGLSGLGRALVAALSTSRFVPAAPFVACFLAAGACAALGSGCGDVVVDGAGASTTAATTGSSTAGGGGEGAGGAPCVPTTAGTGGSKTQTTACFTRTGPTCPSAYQASQDIVPGPCMYLVSVDCGPVESSGACCYVVTEQAHPCGE